MEKVYISEIQKFCVHDGPGIRTTVFFQGCPLHCKWCQNPETLSLKPVILYDKNLCAGCQACLNACKNAAISLSQEEGILTNKQDCILCGDCTKECFFLSRKLSSKPMSVEEVYESVMKDQVVFRKSGGGITLSGGEPLLNPKFCMELLKKIKFDNISTAVETAGFLPQKDLMEVAEYVDTFLFDMKLLDEKKHTFYTGVSNHMIISNLKALTDIHNNVVIRIPLIPGVNDDDAEFSSMIGFITSLRHVNSVHILPFHHLGSNKYDLIGEKYAMSKVNEENEDRVIACQKMAENVGFRVSVGGTGFLDDKKEKKYVSI